MIDTENLTLLPFGEEHLTDRYVSWLRDPEVTRFSEQRFRQHSLESCRAYWESFRGTDNIFFAIVHRSPALGHIGNINVYIEHRHGLADIGILIGDRRAWGRGLGTEAWLAMMRHLFTNPAIRKVTGGCVAANTSMVKIMKRCGMVEDGRRSRHYVYDGAETDVIYAAAFRDHWSLRAS